MLQHNVAGASGVRLVPKQAYHNGLMPVRASVGRGAQGGVLDAAGGRVGVV
jgi:hypothetical protein